MITDGEPIALPLNLAARDSITIYIDIKMIVLIPAWAAVGETIGLGVPLESQEAERIFNKAGHLCFGQLSYVETEHSADYSVDKYGSGITYQSFWIRFLKTDNYQITGEFSLMSNNMHIQGEA